MRLLAGTALVVVAASAFGCPPLVGRLRGAPRTAYETAPVVERRLEVELSAPGRLELIEAAAVSAPIGGSVARVLVSEGHRVRRGDALVELAPDALALDVARASAEVGAAAASRDQAKIALEAAEDALARGQRLREAGLASAGELVRLDAEVGRARAAYRGASAAVGARRTAERGARDQRDSAVLRAPVDGVVVRVDALPGRPVAPAAGALVVIAPTLDRLQLVAAIDEADVASATRDAKVTFNVPAYPERSFAATLDRVSITPTPSAAGVAYDALLVVENADGLLRPGMTASVDMAVAQREQALVVPEAALRFSLDGAAADRRHVLVLDGGTPRAIPVTPGASDGVHTEVAGALHLGDRVVTGRAAAAKPSSLAGGR